MRLALITHKFVKGDGQGRVNYELARAALAAGHTVFLLASEVATDLASHPLARHVKIGLAGMPSALLQNQVFACRTWLWLLKHRAELDLVHANGFVSWSGSHINSSHFVHAAWVRSPFHSWRVRRNVNGLYQMLYGVTGEWLERWSYRRAACVVAVSQQVCRELVSTRLDGRRVRVIPNGVDTDEFRPGRVSRKALGLPEGKLLLFVGDIRTPRKNLDTLLRALRRVPETTLAVVGGVAGSPYPRLAAQLGVAGRVLFLGFRRDVAALMQTADLFVFPSRYEACSLVLLEAAASGLPIVAARTAGGAELLTPECSVLLEDPDDERELAAALHRLLGSPALLARMGVESRRVALANSWQMMAQRYLELYREVLSENHVEGRAASSFLPQKLMRIWRRRRIAGLRRRNGGRGAAEIFSEIYQRNRWGGEAGEFHSGSGSTPAHAEAYARVIREFISAHHVRRVVDLGCGDFRIGARLIEGTQASYTGIDIVPSLIESNRRRYESARVRFECLNIIADQLPAADLCLIRQVLQHLSNEQIAGVLANVARYPAVIVTEHYPAPGALRATNLDKPCGEDVRIYDGSAVFLDAPPFNRAVAARLLDVDAGHCLMRPGERICSYLLLNPSAESAAHQANAAGAG